jgi:GAF domain-containing protein
LRRPSDEEVHALETMTRAASVAMQNVRLRRKLARLNAEAGDGA